ncbi:hypothetical protein GLOTRDRAFT_134343 [Gloeophyllum trabeum ATCC 11539]|uniref:Uncharacterized protein n=1 Tax=Gloeophyllum trabeum (strain ATCC 11539 / FP-39264 / Madison 617) TaxID=670483 RepID=S7RCB4_GLOTA|nr:uncharacterized protein GLOTRDRAFT_134343 [Gloeophyllum trabeum ATCC 11539]EPQ50014.1 hypothetical protein GLOTRDRAFT_134343 [Gloeophyllum trabeum ATCC 11539]
MYANEIVLPSTSVSANLTEPVTTSKQAPQGKKSQSTRKGKPRDRKEAPQAAEAQLSSLEESIPIIFALLFIEYKKEGGSEGQVLNQSRFNLTSGVSNLNAIGILDFPVFALAAVGFNGSLLTAWGEKTSAHSALDIHMADTNCPGWDITDRADAFRLALFLILIRDVWSKWLVEKFQEVRPAFIKDWSTLCGQPKKLSGRFAWRMKDQKGEDIYVKLDKEVKEQGEWANNIRKKGKV